MSADLAKLRDEYLAERGFLVQRYVFCDQPRGVSSDALVKAALFPDHQPKREDYPRDFADLDRCLVAYRTAPDHLRARMKPILRRYCAALGEVEGA